MEVLNLFYANKIITRVITMGNAWINCRPTSAEIIFEDSSM